MRDQKLINSYKLMDEKKGVTLCDSTPHDKKGILAQSGCKSVMTYRAHYAVKHVSSEAALRSPST